MAYGVHDKIKNVLQRLLPERALQDPPLMPPDVFGVAAFLLEVSGAYHHIKPADCAPPSPTRTLWVTDEMRERAKSTASEWIDLYRIGRATPLSRHWPNRLIELWKALTKEKTLKSSVYVKLSHSDTPPDWWAIALELLMIADEAASSGIGWTAEANAVTEWDLVFGQMWSEDLKKGSPDLVSLALEVSADVCCVVPKCRTSSVGCTLRSISHHLALLPAQGITRVYWAPPLCDQPPDSKALNLLLVPLPYRVSSQAFRERQSELGEDCSWRWFELEQPWLTKPEILTSYIRDLIKEAEKSSGKVNGVIFPELALDHNHYIALRDELENNFEDVEILVAGLSNDQNGMSGNFAAMTVFARGATKTLTHMKSITRIRQKHHRWKLDASQIGTYALADALAPSHHWWESLDILSRSVDVVVFRKASALTTLICEDLARVDPCQEALRAIGPNLVIALLMDGAQIDGRWPHRYATVLADDPGSSVLTFTSLGLINRANDEGSHTSSRAVASWKDPSGGRKVIDLASGTQAVLVTLVAREVVERTLDGRGDHSGSIGWQYGSKQPVQLPSSRMEAEYRTWIE